MKKGSLWLQNFTLYQFNNQQFQTGVKQLNQSPLKITSYNESSLTGNVTIKSAHATLMTTVPYSKGWYVTVDGKRAKPIQVAGTFMA